MIINFPFALVAAGLAHFNTELPEYGLVSGPDGEYLTRSTGPWGASGREEIWRYPSGATEPVRPDWARSDASESDFYFDAKSADGFFISDRHGDPDIWRVRWRAGAWSPATRLPAPVNLEGYENSPVVSADGRLCFASVRDGGEGAGDLYCARELANDEWRVDALSAFNTPAGEWNLGFSADGETIIFEASGRASNKSASGDLYISRREQNDWSAPVPLSRLNTTNSDLMARFQPDASVIFTRSDGNDADLLHAHADDLRTLTPSIAAVARSSGEVVLLDPVTLSERARIEVGDGPHDIASSEDGRIAIVPLHGVFPRPHAEPISPSQLRWENAKSAGYALVDLVDANARPIPLSNCPRPHGAAIAAQGQTAWITCETRGEIREINPLSGETLRVFKTAKGVHKVMLLADMKKLAATNPDAGEAYIVDLSSGDLTTIRTGGGAEALAASADQSVVWVANSFAKTICAIDVASAALDRCHATGGAFPIAIASDDTAGKIWVLRNASSDLVSISSETADIVDEIDLPSRPLGLAFDRVHRRLFVTLPRLNAVMAIDADSLETETMTEVIMEGDDLDLIPAAAFETSPDT